MDGLKTLSFAMTFGLGVLAAPAFAQTDYENLGKHLSEEELAGWNIDVLTDGQGLPPGEGTVAEGKLLYQTQCLACHGANLEGGALGPALVGGEGSLTTDKPVKTIGSYWPYATTIFDYIRRAMPFQTPKSLSNEEVYGVTAYLLHKNNILPETATVGAENLASIKMPNRNNFYIDNRPDVKAAQCMEECLPAK